MWGWCCCYIATSMNMDQYSVRILVFFWTISFKWSSQLSNSQIKLAFIGILWQVSCWKDSYLRVFIVIKIVFREHLELCFRRINFFRNWFLLSNLDSFESKPWQQLWYMDNLVKLDLGAMCFNCKSYSLFFHLTPNYGSSFKIRIWGKKVCLLHSFFSSYCKISHTHSIQRIFSNYWSFKCSFTFWKSCNCDSKILRKFMVISLNRLLISRFKYLHIFSDCHPSWIVTWFIEQIKPLFMHGDIHHKINEIQFCTHWIELF